MGWLCLVVAGLFEIVWAVGLKQSDGFTRLWPSVITLAAMWLSFGFLSVALKSIPMGNAYAVWTAIGSVGVAIVGILYFGEHVDIKRILFIALIVIGVIGLKFAGSGAALSDV